MKLLAASILLCIAAAPVAQAKLPPLPADAQAKADEAKAKAAWSDKVAAYQLCKAMDRTAEFYLKTAKSAGQETRAPAPTPPCAEPGAYVSASASAPSTGAKPLEASGAHSSAATATSPPGGKSAQAELQGTKKK
jgi:hypothetical protein